MKKDKAPPRSSSLSRQKSDLETNPHLFRQLLDASGVAMVVRNIELDPIFFNRAFSDFYGYSAEDIHRIPMAEVLPENTLRTYIEEITPAIHSGKSWEGEYVIRTQSGLRRPVWGRFDPVLDEAGNLTHVISIMRDVSEAKRLRNALSQAEQYLHFLAGNISDCLFRLRLSDGRYDYISPAVETITGYRSRQFYDKPRFLEQLAEESWSDTFDRWWTQLLDGASRKEYEFPIRHKDGSRKWISQRITLTKDDAGTPLAIEGVITDVTARKEAETELATAQKSLHFISRSTSDIFFRLRIPEGTYDYLSPSVERFSGYSIQEYQDNPLLIRKIVPEDWQGYFNETWEELLRGKVRPEYEFQYTHKSGEVRWARQRVILIKDRNGNPIAIEGIATDATDHKQAEEALRESERRFRTLFKDSPISLWEEDLTRLKAYFDELKDSGITDFRQHFYSHPKALTKCATLVDVVDINRATLELLGAKSKDELLGNLDRVLTESSMGAFTEEMILLASGGFEYQGEITHRTLQGDIIWVAVHFAVPPEYQDTLSRVLVSLIDVTPRKRVEQALMESEERYRALVENSQEGVVVVVGCKPVFINEATSDILGYSLNELPLLSSKEIVHPQDANSVSEQLKKYVDGQRKEGFATCRVLTKSGHEKWITMSVKPIVWGGQNAELQILTDISAHKILEEELRAAHRDMEKRVNLRTSELSEANLLLQEEVVEREKAQEHIFALTKDIILVQEAERQRIARDLHDNVAQDLSSIVLKLETLFDGHDRIDPELYNRGDAAARVVKKAIAAVRDIAYGLRPPALDQLGLTRALENYCQEIARRAGVLIDFFSTGIESGTMDSDTEINVYRMLQEALNNVAKHARASKVTVRMVKSHPDIILRIEDNGRGFDVARRLAQAADEKRMGIRSMEERARLIGGSMEIQSLAGKGTRIIFTVPLEHARRL